MDPDQPAPSVVAGASRLAGIVTALDGMAPSQESHVITAKGQAKWSARRAAEQAKCANNARGIHLPFQKVLYGIVVAR